MKKTAVAAIALALTAGATTATAAATTQPDPTVVRTDKGLVRGSATESVRTFEGIPYAAPPTGDRRWSPPVPAKSWSGARDATKPGSACPQTGLTPPAGRKSSNEDCLSVNVTTPRTAAAKPRPVMVYLHGGDHTDGAGAMQGARRLAARGDVIVVTLNYRLAALGYLAHPALERNGTESGNYGFLDQQAALRWVQRNAAAFGGDPDNVTLFGESAGGYSTCAHMVAPSSAGLFDRVIQQSAPCTADMGSRTRADALADGERATGAIEKEHDLDDFRDATPDQLINPFGTGPKYTPVYGGELLPRTPQEALAEGDFAKVPVLRGINRDEERVMVYGYELAKKAETGDPDAQLDEADVREHLEQQFGEQKAARIAARYPVSAYDSPALALAAALTDGKWARPSVDTGKALSAHTRTYSYEFADRPTPWYSDPGFPKPGFDIGTAHTFDLPYLFELEDFEALTPAQRQLSNQMIDIWTGFARTGKAPWKPTTPAEPNVQALASDPGGIRPVDFAKRHNYGFWKSL